MRQGIVSSTAGTAHVPIRVFITDSHPIFRRGIRCTLRIVPDVELVGEASNGMSAVSQARRMLPDIVIVGINLPASSGLEVAGAIMSQLPGTPLVLMTDADIESQLPHAVTVGASAVLSKSVSPQELLECLRTVASGKSLITQRRSKNQGSLPINGLAPRQIEVLEHIAAGYSNKEIARALNISSQTVKHHITAVMRRLCAKDRTEAVVHALQQGWLHIGNENS